MYLHILFIVQGRNANVLLTDAETDELSELTYDMLVSFYLDHVIFQPISQRFNSDGRLIIFD